MAEQRYQAVLAVIGEGGTVTEVAGRWGVSRQSVHSWLARYEAGGLEGWRTGRTTTDTSCLVATIVVSPSTPAGSTSATLFNHYSLLGTAEQLLGLPALGAAASAPTMTSAFNL